MLEKSVSIVLNNILVMIECNETKSVEEQKNQHSKLSRRILIDQNMMTLQEYALRDPVPLPSLTN